MNIKSPKQALNPVFQRQKPANMEQFRTAFLSLLGKINTKESEEHNKNLLKDFFNDAYYKNEYEINAYNDTQHKIRADFAVRQKGNAFVEMLIEVKNPNNQAEMPSKDNLNKKALQELLLYYMSERVINKNKSLRHFIVTNLYEWFVFDAADFYELFIEKNKDFLDKFNQYSKKQLEGDKTKYFYDEIARPEIERLMSCITFVYFDIRDYENADTEDENFIALYKFLSPTHLLKRDVYNDSNSLNSQFYNELLHILGLTETKSEGKIKIERKTKNRDEGSLLELTIAQLETMDISTVETQNIASLHFDIAFSLVITWINRILFMKLLEAQLLKYHNNHPDYAFLSAEKVNAYSKLNTLFFQVLAQTQDKRPSYLNEFDKVPYLNSSLFEPTDLENETLKISELSNEVFLPLYEKTVLTHKANDALNYLLQFLNAYNFSGKQEENEDPNKLISAAVLGLIFEKINGYQDGSFFTPSFITMYMCRETIGRAVVQKFVGAYRIRPDKTGIRPMDKTDEMGVCGNGGINDNRGVCDTPLRGINDLHNIIPQIGIERANEIFNQIRICDPAVGSGHFLVSALNEMIYLKSQLGILADKNGKTLWNYSVSVVNDDLVIRNPDGDIFVYNPKNAESQRVQETFFREKQTLIENCLFGVDINPNSVKICQLRLWIELLKHAYYTSLQPPPKEGEVRSFETTVSNATAVSQLPKGQKLPSFGRVGGGALQTLPNIDINIKCGNSLMSRFDLADKYHNISGLEQKIKQATKKYKEQVFLYKQCDNKEAKRQIVKNIENEKNIFYYINNVKDTDYQNLESAKNALVKHTLGMFPDLQTEEWQQETTQLTENLRQLETLYKEKIRGCFEWRFEFPEVLDEDGNFVGFDVVMGNPPYVNVKNGINAVDKSYYMKTYKTAIGQFDLFSLFIEKGLSLGKMLALIVPKPLINNENYEIARKLIFDVGLKSIVIGSGIFESAGVESCIFTASKTSDKTFMVYDFVEKEIVFKHETEVEFSKKTPFTMFCTEINDNKMSIFNKMSNNVILLSNIVEITRGVEAGKSDVSITKFKNDYKLLRGEDMNKYTCDYKNFYIDFDNNNKTKFKPIQLYFSNKMLIRRVANELLAFYDTENHIVLNSIYCCLSKNNSFDLKFIIALINSKLIGYWFKTLFVLTDKLFPYIRKSQLEFIPIKNIPLSEQQPIISLVDEILQKKKENVGADVSEEERKINEMVYALYGVDEEEIKIIEK